MGVRNRELCDAIEKCLAQLGADGVAFDMGGKHMAVDFRVKGRWMRQSFTTTPSDHRYIKNTIRDLKRHIRETLDRPPRTP